MVAAICRTAGWRAALRQSWRSAAALVCVPRLRLCNSEPVARSTQAPAVEDDLIDVLLSVSRAMVALAARNLSDLDTDVTLQQYRALVFLSSNGHQRSSDLARELGVAPSTVTRMCDRLVRKGLIRRVLREDDRRPIWLCLTETGRDLVGTIMRERRDELERVVTAAGLTSSRRTLQLLQKFVTAAGEMPNQQWWQRWEVSADREPGTWPAQPERQDAA